MFRHYIAPILESTLLYEQHLEYLVILPWNIAAEIKQQHAGLVELGTQFVTVVPNPYLPHFHELRLLIDRNSLN